MDAVRRPGSGTLNGLGRFAKAMPWPLGAGTTGGPDCGWRSCGHGTDHHRGPQSKTAGGGSPRSWGFWLKAAKTGREARPDQSVDAVRRPGSGTLNGLGRFAKAMPWSRSTDCFKKKNYSLRKREQLAAAGGLSDGAAPVCIVPYGHSIMRRVHQPLRQQHGF